MRQTSERRDLLSLLSEDRGRFITIAQRVVKCRSKAEDVVQDAALRIWQGYREGQHEPFLHLRSPAGFLSRMIRNLAIDVLRRSCLEYRLLAPIAAADTVASPCACPQARIEACETLRIVLATLDVAPERSRRAMLAHRLDGIPQKAIATETGVSPTLVNVMIRDTTAACRKAIADDARPTARAA